jgi:hypothetical protein
MSSGERNAWFVLAVVGLTVASYAVAMAVWGPGPGSTGALYVIILAGLLPLVQRSPRPGVACDERDGEIGRKATLAAFAAVWLILFLLPSTLVGAQGWRRVMAVPVWAVFQVQMWIVVLTAAVWAGATIRLYRRVR